MWKSFNKTRRSHVESGQFPLAFCRTGDEVTIAAVKGGKKLRNRINEIGLLPGIRIRVIQANHTGPFMINYRGSNLALGHGLALHLLVHP